MEKEHKKNWRETYASPAEIKAFLSDHVYLRYNTVKHRVEVRLPPEDPFCCNSELAQFVSDRWQPMNDRLKNTLLTALQAISDTRKTDLETVLDSGFVQEFQPFRYYLNRLPPWDGQDYILSLSATVSVKGGIERQLFFAQILKRWLVGMVASWLDEETVNQIDTWHRKQGWKLGIGYHYVVRRDGTIEPGRPEWMVGAHCRNHNAHSVGVCYEGGINIRGQPADTRTAEQKASLRRLLD